MFSWNLLGILLWVIILLYLVFVIQSIRKRRIKMIIQEHKRFSWPNFLLSVVQVLVLIVAAGWLFAKTAFDNPDLDDTSIISSKVEYQPLVMTTGTGKSSYVTINSSKRKYGSQTYTYYQAGTKVTVGNNYASVAYGATPLNITAEKIPYELKTLKKMDKKYQRAYVAVYTATYKKTWQNGIGLHAGRIATRYYLIRIPDQSFIKQNRK